MTDEVHYTDSHKRKYDETTPPPPPPPSTGRRSTGFSAPIIPPPSSSANFSSPPSAAAGNEIEIAKQRAQAIAARLFSDAEAKRPKHDNNGGGFDATPFPPAEPKPPMTSNFHAGSGTSSYGYQMTSKRIDIPNNRVGVIIGKGGETIKYLQSQSGAKIQVTRDMDADLGSPTRTVELMGTPDQIANAEQLISEVLAEADAGGSGTVSRRMPGQDGSDQFVMKVANNKVGLVIGKGGETIKSIQARTGARVQVIPLHLPPGDTSTERTVQIDGSPEQVEAAKQLVIEVTSENRGRSSGMGGGYSQQGYQRSATSWAPPPPTQQPGYGYMQPGAYSGQSAQYSSQPNYPGYPPQPTGAYPTSWDQTNGQAGQQAPQGASYGYYSQQPSQPASSTGPPDNTGYNYSQYPAASYGQQGYPQDAYSSGGYSASGAQAGYGQPPTNPQQGYDQQQAYNTAATYGNSNNQTQDGQNSSYGTQGETGQASQPSQPPLGQQGYSTGQQPTSGYPGQGPDQVSYAMPPSSQPSYGTQQSAQGAYGSGYGPPPPAQKAVTNPPAYGQPQQSPSQGGGYGQAASAPQAYSHSQQAHTQPGYPQTDTSAQRTATAYGTGPASGQPGSYPSPYGAPPGPPPTYGQQPPVYNSSYGAAYAQSAAYPADGSTTPVTPQAAAAQPSGVPKTSSES